MPHEIRRKKGTYLVYRQAEADAENIRYTPWREVEEGGWGLTDDGYVAECIARKTYTDKHGATKTHLTFSFARTWLPRKTPFLFEPFHQSGHYGGTSPKGWVEIEARKARTKRTVEVYVQMLILRREIDWVVLGNSYRPDQKIPAATVRRLFRQTRIQKMVQVELRAVLSGEGIDEQEVVRMYRKAFETAENTKNPAAMRQVAKDLAGMLDMKPTGQGMSLNYGPNYAHQQLPEADLDLEEEFEYDADYDIYAESSESE